MNHDVDRALVRLLEDLVAVRCLNWTEYSSLRAGAYLLQAQLIGVPPRFSEWLSTRGEGREAWSSALTVRVGPPTSAEEDYFHLQRKGWESRRAGKLEDAQRFSAALASGFPNRLNAHLLQHDVHRLTGDLAARRTDLARLIELVESRQAQDLERVMAALHVAGARELAVIWRAALAGLGP